MTILGIFPCDVKNIIFCVEESMGACEVASTHER